MIHILLSVFIICFTHVPHFGFPASREIFASISLDGGSFKLAENSGLARLRLERIAGIPMRRNGPVYTRAQHPGNVYSTCTFHERQGRINSTVSHRHPYEIRSLRRLSDLFCQRKRFRCTE